MLSYEQSVLKGRELIDATFERLVGYFRSTEGPQTNVSRIVWDGDNLEFKTLIIRFNALPNSCYEPHFLDVNLFGLPDRVTGKEFTDEEKISMLASAIESASEEPSTYLRLFYEREQISPS